MKEFPARGEIQQPFPQLVVMKMGMLSREGARLPKTYLRLATQSQRLQYHTHTQKNLLARGRVAVVTLHKLYVRAIYL